jgi:hypothetical protein
LVSSSVDAKIVPAQSAWPYEKLFKHADLVVIVRPIRVREALAKDAPKPPRDYETRWTAIITTFEVLSVVKGTHENRRLTICHFMWHPKARRVNNGPELACFHNRAEEGETVKSSGVKKKDYMLFLKKDKAGRLEFVSGPINPDVSVIELQRGTSSDD